MLVDIIILHAYFIYPSLIFFWFDWYICVCAKLSNKSIRLNYFLISSKIQLYFLSGFSVHFIPATIRITSNIKLKSIRNTNLVYLLRAVISSIFSWLYWLPFCLALFQSRDKFSLVKARYFHLSLRNEILREIRHSWRKNQSCLDWTNFPIEMELKLNI